MTTSVLRATSPTDLLACVPSLLGFHPQRSVVLVTIGVATTPVHARVDLPEADALAPVETDAELDALSVELAEVAGRHGVARAAVVLYTDDADLAGRAGVRMVHELGAAGVATAMVLRADGRRWFVHRPDGAAVPQDRGTGYSLRGHPLTLQAVVAGAVVHPDRAALRATVDPVGPEALARVERAAGPHLDRMASAAAGPRSRWTHLVGEGTWLQGRVRRFAEDRLPLDDEDAGRVVAGCLSVQVRDVAWAEMSQETAGHHVDLWRDVVRRCPTGLLAAPAALLAFAAWLSGHGALAWCALERCEEADPDYSMAALVTHALAAAVPPTTWAPPPATSLPLFAPRRRSGRHP